MLRAFLTERLTPLLQGVRLLLLRFLLSFVFYSLCRGVFYLYNRDLLEVSSGSLLGRIFAGALRFDLSAICYSHLLLTVLSLLPLPWVYRRGYQRLLTWVYGLVGAFAIVLNLGDVVYYRFTLKRTTMAVLEEFSHEDPFQFLHFFTDYWVVTLVGLVFILGLVRLDRLFPRPSLPARPLSWLHYLSSTALLVGAVYLSIVGGRGGAGLTTRPISMSNAALYIERPQQRALVLNTPFCLLRTLGKREIPELHYLDQRETLTYFDPIYTPGETPVSGSFQGRNIVLIVWESFAREWVGGLNRDLPDYKSYTPFVDSLLQHAYVFEQAYANGQQSVDALPAILSSIIRPGASPLITSLYAVNTLPSLPARLDSMGYTTAFFHGAPNGSMGFDALVHQLGIKHYYGKTEYGDDRDFDGYWGIWDEKFLQWTARELSKLRSPFLGTIFTLSSHDPYQVPERYQAELPKGTIPIQQAIAYSDLSLRKFFETAQREPWYANTLFVVVADHSVRGVREEYKTSAGFFRIPILLFDPQGTLTGREAEQVIGQADLYPTLLDLVGDKRPMVAFGSSVFDPARPRFTVNYLDGAYQLIEDGWLLQFDGEHVLGLYDLRRDPQERDNRMLAPDTPRDKMLQRLKAYLQSYSHRMRTNQLTELHLPD